MSKVLLTGASGVLGSHMRHWFAAHGRAYLPTDIKAATDGEAVELVDFTDPAAIGGLMQRDIGAVLHLGGHPSNGSWDTVRSANIDGTFQVFEAARLSGVRRIVFASSYHVMGMYPSIAAPVGDDADVRPDSLYAVSKVFGEALGRYYADRYEMDVLSVRICCANPPNSVREARNWCDRDDFARLVDYWLDSPLRGYHTVYAASDNPNPFFANGLARELGWTPQSTSEANSDYDPRQPLDDADPINRFIGGRFAIA